MWGQADAKVEEHKKQNKKGEASLNGQCYTLQKCLLGVLGYSGQILQCWVESWEM